MVLLYLFSTLNLEPGLTQKVGCGGRRIHRLSPTCRDKTPCKGVISQVGRARRRTLRKLRRRIGGKGPPRTRASLSNRLFSSRWARVGFNFPLLGLPLALPWGPSCHSLPSAVLRAWSPPTDAVAATVGDMEPLTTSIHTTGKRPSLGRCKHFFWLGVIFDTVGVAVLFTGVFADLLFYDMLLYLGSIIIFFSLLWWISWYTGNIELLPEEASRRSTHTPSAPTAETLRRSASHRFSWTIESISNTFRMQRRHLRSLKRRDILSMTVAGLEGESKGKDGRESIKDSGDPQDICKENLHPEPEDDNSPEAVSSPGPEAGGGMSLLVRPVFPSSLLDQPLPSAILASKSPTVAPSVPAQPPLIASRSQSVGPVALKNQLPVNLSLTSHPATPMAFQSHLVVPVSPPSPLQVHMASESKPQNLPWDFQTQSPTVRASGSQAMATQVPLMPFQVIDPQISQAVQDFQLLLPTQQASHSTSVVEEISQSQSSCVLGVPKVPVVRAFEAPPLPSQKLTPEIPEAAASVPETQQSICSDNTPGSGVVKKSHPL
ncbi:PREDICTED: transmembrane protein 238 [Chinchilla lanigera]|uniref:transmembrane protein 238 n=1 Tax=Chinchilla lanigera TaxID=34839 RepID=UPI00038EA268|nr:PREDICTED: transmembrane protein 238 [Chinchilla lanigera]